MVSSGIKLMIPPSPVIRFERNSVRDKTAQRTVNGTGKADQRTRGKEYIIPVPVPINAVFNSFMF